MTGIDMYVHYTVTNETTMFTLREIKHYAVDIQTISRRERGGSKFSRSIPPQSTDVRRHRDLSRAPTSPRSTIPSNDRACAADS